MIVKPTVKELLDHAENRYALVIATSKRARQIADGAEKLTDTEETSAVTVAANEIAEGKVKIIEKDEENIILDSKCDTENEIEENIEEEQEKDEKESEK